jgi:hypothetical protein
MFYELRQYNIKPGCMDEWVEFMEQEIVPFQISKGMVITGMYRGEQDDGLYVWLWRFDSEAQRETLYEAVHQSDYWKTEVTPRVDQLLDREAIKVLRIVPTPNSTVQ